MAKGTGIGLALIGLGAVVLFWLQFDWDGPGPPSQDGEQEVLDPCRGPVTFEARKGDVIPLLGGKAVLVVADFDSPAHSTMSASVTLSVNGTDQEPRQLRAGDRLDFECEEMHYVLRVKGLSRGLSSESQHTATFTLTRLIK